MKTIFVISVMIAALSGITLMTRKTIALVPLAQALQSDAARLKAISTGGAAEDGIHMLSMPLKLTRRDMKLIDKDKRRARAAYPDTTDLYIGRWFAFDTNEKMTSDEYGIHNSQSSKPKDAPEDSPYFLESGYITIVNPAYADRATAGQTIQYFDLQNQIERAHPGFKALKQQDRSYTGYDYGVPYLSDEFLMWAADKDVRPIAIGSGTSDFILSVYRKTDKPFVWDDGSHGNDEAIRVRAPQSKLQEAEDAIRRLVEENAFSIYFYNHDKSVSQTIYQLQEEGSVDKQAEVIEWTIHK